MNLNYLRVRVFQGLLKPVSMRARRIRMRMFTDLMKVEPGLSIIDLGGQPRLWDFLHTQAKITILNLPGAIERYSSRHDLSYIEGDACDVSGIHSNAFDMVFSNSVIEHVGDSRKQAEFAREVVRLGRSYWVQTPAKAFPIEAHCGMPFWWFYPETVRAYLINRWRQKLPAWTEMVEGTRVLSKGDLQRLFPDATIIVETLFGIPKSYIAYRSPDSNSRNAES